MNLFEHLKKSLKTTKRDCIQIFFLDSHVKMEPSLKIVKSNSCTKCENEFAKGHLTVHPAKQIICKKWILKNRLPNAANREQDALQVS